MCETHLKKNAARLSTADAQDEDVATSRDLRPASREESRKVKVGVSWGMSTQSHTKTGRQDSACWSERDRPRINDVEVLYVAGRGEVIKEIVALEQGTFDSCFAGRAMYGCQDVYW